MEDNKNIPKYYPYSRPIIEPMEKPKAPAITAYERYGFNNFTPVFGKITIKNPIVEENKNG